MKIAEILKQEEVLNHEGAPAFRMDKELELYSAVVTSALENTYYEGSPERMRRIVNLVEKVDSLFVARLAVYARQVMNLRSIPLVLLVELARIHNGDDLVSRAVAATVLRADEIAELLMCYQWRNPTKGYKRLGSLSRGIQNGLKLSFNRFDEYQFAKYARDGQGVTLKDALYLVHPKAKDAAQQLLFDKIAKDELAIPYTWETEFSAVGQRVFSSPEEKKAAQKETWERLILSGRLGYMAMLRNLRNILAAQVGEEAIARVCATLSDPKEVARSRQMPFRFLSAYRELENKAYKSSFAVKQALEAAVQASAANITGFNHWTRVLLACDVSGSMRHPISRHSKVELYDIGLMMAMLLQKSCGKVLTGIFGSQWKLADMNRAEILSGTMSLRHYGNSVGFDTNGHLVIDYLLKNGIRMDKVLMFTDCQLWNSHGTGRLLAQSWQEYRHFCPNAQLYLFDLAGYGITPVRVKEDGVCLIAGWNDKVFDVLDALERGEDALSEINKIVL